MASKCNATKNLGVHLGKKPYFLEDVSFMLVIALALLSFEFDDSSSVKVPLVKAESINLLTNSSSISSSHACIETVYYDGFEEAGMQANNETETGITGYATADLQLMTLNYKLFSDMAVKLCGDWIYSAQDGNNDCPNDGIYHFETIYKLPESTDYKTWFATGWKGTSTIAIRSERSAYDGSELGSLLGYCELHFSTYTTQTDSDEFKTLPSAMVVTISLAAAAALFSMCACYLACCRKGRPIAVDEPPSEEADQYQKMEDGGMVSQKIKRSKQEKDYFDPIAMSRSQEK